MFCNRTEPGHVLTLVSPCSPFLCEERVRGEDLSQADAFGKSVKHFLTEDMVGSYFLNACYHANTETMMLYGMSRICMFMEMTASVG